MARNSKNIIRLVENTDIRIEFDIPYDNFHCSKIECTIMLFTKAMSMTHTVWLIRFVLYNFLKHSRTDSSKRTVRRCPRTCPVQNQYICSRCWYYVIITSSWRHQRYYSLLILFFRNFQKAYFCTDWNSWLVQKMIFQNPVSVLPL